MALKPALYLLPTPISENDPLQFIPEMNLHLVRQLQYFIAEDAKTARAVLKLMGYPEISKAIIVLLNEHTRQHDMKEIEDLLKKGQPVGLMSDAGCPGIADPGAAAVLTAHRLGFPVIPLAGPSSIVLSVMASGFNGQQFAFNGYLPVDPQSRVKKIRDFESLSAKTAQSQFFIETPYRNGAMLESLLKTLRPDTLLFIGKAIGEPGQLLVSRTVAEWRKVTVPDLHKQPTVMGIQAGANY